MKEFPDMTRRHQTGWALLAVLLLSSSILRGQSAYQFDIQSPDGALRVHVSARPALQWSVQHKGQQIIAPSTIALRLADGSVLGYEGVRGLENVKWATEDVPRYDVSIPFIRMVAGPMDYTPGAMRNAARANFRPINDMPMSQGTRCHQLAMYVVFEAPLQMLSDNPTIYRREQECTDFITSIPTTFDETVTLDGEVGEYVALARRKGDTWYVGAMSNWSAREVTLDMSFLGAGVHRAEVFKDGVNADRDATDYVREVIRIAPDVPLAVQLSKGGGWAARIERLK